MQNNYASAGNQAQVGGSIGRDAAPVETLQVDSQLDGACWALDSLEATVATMLRRLEPVTGGWPEEACKESGGINNLVPIAARVSYIESRVRNANVRLERAINALQI